MNHTNITCIREKKKGETAVAKDQLMWRTNFDRTWRSGEFSREIADLGSVLRVETRAMTLEVAT